MNKKPESSRLSPVVCGAEEWDELERRMAEKWCNKAVVLGVGFPESATEKIAGALRTGGSKLVGFAPNLEPIVGEKKLAAAFSHFVVNLDSYNDVLHAVDELLKLRKSSPEAVVLIVSTSVRADDLSLERQQICHATLRVPFGLDRFRGAFVAATENAASSGLSDGNQHSLDMALKPIGSC